jgi:hypothetical protein
VTGVPVTIDSDDLEALLFSTAAIKSVENALIAQKRDEQFKSAAGRFSAAHDRAANAWREATRRRDRPELFREPTAKELEELRRLDLAGARGPQGIEVNVGSLRHLLGPGWIEFGVHRQQVNWTGSGAVWQHETAAPRCRLTARGIDELGKAFPPIGEGVE